MNILPNNTCFSLKDIKNCMQKQKKEAYIPYFFCSILSFFLFSKDIPFFP